jgi:hypothetical protein
VTYRVEFQPPVLRQLNGFPGGALDALVSAMVDVTQPSSAAPAWSLTKSMRLVR